MHLKAVVEIRGGCEGYSVCLQSGKDYEVTDQTESDGKWCFNIHSDPICFKNGLKLQINKDDRILEEIDVEVDDIPFHLERSLSPSPEIALKMEIEEVQIEENPTTDDFDAYSTAKSKYRAFLESNFPRLLDNEKLIHKKLSDKPEEVSEEEPMSYDSD